MDFLLDSALLCGLCGVLSFFVGVLSEWNESYKTAETFYGICFPLIIAFVILSVLFCLFLIVEALR